MLPFSNARSTAWRVRRPQGWVFSNTVMQFGQVTTMLWAPSEDRRAAWGFQAFAAPPLQCLPCPLGFGCWESRPSAGHHQSGPFYYFSQFMGHCSFKNRGSQTSVTIKTPGNFGKKIPEPLSQIFWFSQPGCISEKSPADMSTIAL